VGLILVTIAVEGDSDALVAQRVLECSGLALGPVHVQGGKTELDRKLRSYNWAARRIWWLVLRDLDHDATCAPALVQKLLPDPAPQMCLRIAIRAAEAWLLADRERMSKFLGVTLARIPSDPEKLDNPKRLVVDLARRSRLRAIREDMVPAVGTSASVGPGYTARIIEFAAKFWRPAVAAQNSESLSRCLERLRSITGE
jgi:hypothetical protein